MVTNELLTIIQHYGFRHQVRKLAEENFELIDALLSESKSVDNIAEEMADCLVVMAQFQKVFAITDKELKTIAEKKIKRTLKRIEDEKNNGCGCRDSGCRV